MSSYKFLHNLLNVQVQIANKMGLQKKKKQTEPLASKVRNTDTQTDGRHL
jgi:hypothetical protein